MAVQIDEARGDDTVRGVEHDLAAQARSHRHDAAVLNRDVGGRIEALRRIDHAAAANHQGMLDRAFRPRGWAFRDGAPTEPGGQTAQEQGATTQIHYDSAP